jgi:PilZ domain
MRGSRTPGSRDRRSWRRYAVALAVRWRLLLGKNVVESGAGMTVDLSSHGMLLEADRELRRGAGIQASIAWPVLLPNAARLQLVIGGEVVWTAGVRAAVLIRHHEFRTVAGGRAAGAAGGPSGSSPHNRRRPLAARPAPQ